MPPSRPLIELNEKQQMEQRVAISSSVTKFLQVTNADSKEKILAAICQVEFNIRLREMDYVQKM